MSGAGVLITASVAIPADVEAAIARGHRPRADYLELARNLGADVLDFNRARARTGRLGRLVEKVAGPRAVLSWAAFRSRRDYDVIFTDGEQIGLPLACLLRLRRGRPVRHAMIVHVLSARPKVLLHKVFRLAHHIDLLLVYATAQRRFATCALDIPESRVVRTPFMVDTCFFAPAAVRANPTRMICAVGLERRDYRTLLAAVDGLDVTVVIAAGSPWSSWRDKARAEVLPSNVVVCTLDFVALRQLYADALFVVMPLEDADYQAGITTILEAMAMERAVVCSSARGQADTIVDGETGVYVPPGDAPALRRAINALLDDPAAARRMGQAGRRWVEREADISRYAERLAALVLALVP